MKLKVIRRIDPTTYDYECQTEAGDFVEVDLVVDGSLPEKYVGKDLSGFTVEIDRLTPYLYIAYGDSPFTVVDPQEERKVE